MLQNHLRFALLGALALSGALATPAPAAQDLLQEPRRERPVPKERGSEKESAQEPEAPAPPPTPEQIEAASEALTAGLKAEAPEDRIAAVRAAGKVPAKAIAKALAKVAKNETPEVSGAALESLGLMGLDAALSELRKLSKAKGDLRDQDELSGKLIQAIARYRDEKDLKLFSSRAFQTGRPKQTRASLLAFGQVRTDRSLGELIDLMNRAPLSTGRGERDLSHWADLQLTLKVLTGADAGKERRDWQNWWNNNKKSFHVSEAAPELERKDQALWDRAWAEPREPGRERGDEGGRDRERKGKGDGGQEGPKRGRG